MLKKLLPVAVLVFIASFVLASAVIRTEAPASSADLNKAVVAEYSSKPIPCDVEWDGCLFDCDIAQQAPGSGGKCRVKFSVFHFAIGGGCPCNCIPPDELTFCYRESSAAAWDCTEVVREAQAEYNPRAECWGYYYYSAWLELDDDTDYDISFTHTEECYCIHTEVLIDC